MSLAQIHRQIFSGRHVQIASRRVTALRKNHFLERQGVNTADGRFQSVFLNTQKSLESIARSYRHKITSPNLRSDSVEHDLAIVNVRARLEQLKDVTDYLTENVLQACGHLLESEKLSGFVENNTDAALEITKTNRSLWVALEFESSEKARARYVKKLLNYYSNPATPVVLYVCANPRIQDAIAQAEQEIVGSKKPRCFYALEEDVLKPKPECTFQSSKGAVLTLE